MPGQIGCKSIEITLYACLVESVKLGVNPLRLHGLLKALDAGRIRPVELGVNPLRLHCMPAWSNQVELGGNPLRLHCLLKALDTG